MKKTLAILLALILTFSSVSILGMSTVVAAENDGVLLELDLSGTTKWSGNRISTFDDDGDGTKEAIRLNNTTGTSNLNSSTFVLTPGKEYKLSFEIRIPEESIDFADYLSDGTFAQTNPKFAIFQPGNTAAGEKIAEGYGEGKNDYSYKYAKYGTVRRPTFSADWQVGSYPTMAVEGLSGFNSQFYNLLKDDSGNVISPNVAFKDWTTITSTFTAIDDEENGAVGDQVAALYFSIGSGKKGPGLMYDIKNVKLIDVAAQPEPETQKTILTSDFGSDTNWTIRGHVSYTDENSDGVKDFARLKPLSTAAVALRSAPVHIVPGEEYELTFLARIPEESKEFQTDTYNIYPEFAMFQPTLNEDGTKVTNNHGEGTNEYAYKNLRRADFVSTWQIGDFDPIQRNRYSSFSKTLYATACPDTTVDEAYNGWTKVTYKFTGLASAENDGPETVAFYFGISKNANADGCFFDIKDVKLIENPNAAPETPEEPEEPEVPVLRGPEVDEGFEDFTAGTKLYDNELTGTQNMYTYTSKGKLLTGFGDLTVSDQGGYNGSKQSLTGRTYYQYAAMPLALDTNTEYELSFWYTYTTNDADIYLKQLFYGIVKPTEGSNVNESILHGGGGTLRMKEYFAPDEFEMGKWRKATLKFSTGDNVDGLVFAYSYADGLKSDITATVNKTPLYIDDVKIKKVENAPEKVNITVDHKDAASVEITSGYFKDFVVGEKIQFKVRTKDALVPTVTVNGNAIAENNGYYTYTITESDVAIKVECEGDENRGDPNNYNGLPLYEYNQEVAVTPVWEGNVVYHENAFFTTGRETAKLLYPIDKVVAVRSYDLTKIYFEGVDYEIAEDGTLRILEGSQIPVYTGALETDKESSFKFAGKENAYAHFVDNYEYATYAVNVTYEHSDVWTGDEGYNPEAVQSIADKIPGVIEKLEKGEDVEVVILGDSLSTGSSTSGQAYDDLYNDKGGQNINALNYAPFTPSWPVMLEQTLKTLYPKANITFKNIAHGGKTAKWGSERLLTRLGYLERDFGWTYETPDLLILAYGGNDLTAGYTAEQFKGYMQSIITQYREYKQDESAEILLWTETRHHTQVTQYTKENHDAYHQVNYDLAEENGSIGVVDTLNVFNEVVQSKPETDLFSDCVIHVNDFATRVIVQSFVAGLTKPKYLAGDINGDEVNNLKDLIVLARYVAEWENLEVVEDILVVNLDGIVDLEDVRNLAKHLAGWKDVTVNGSFFTEYLKTTHTLTGVQSKLKLNNRATFDGDNLRMEWSASGFTVQGQFSGDFILNNIKTIDPGTGNTEEVLFYAVLDGNLENAVQLRTPGKGEDVTALQYIKPGFHTIQILKASEAKAVAMTIGGITYNGSLFSAPAEKELKMEFIGDSISSAMGLYTKEAEPDWLLRTDITKGYAIKVADHFDADFNIVSCSNGSVCSEAPYMYDEYQNLYFGNTDVKYDFASRTEPDVVVIALGANDTPAYITKDENNKTVPADNIDVLKQGITDMLTMVRSKNPSAKIVWVYGMMEVRIHAIYEETVKAFAETDGNTYYTMISRNDCNGQGGHPTPEGHTANANELVTFLENNVLNK